MTPIKARELMITDQGQLTKREAEALLWMAEGKTAWETGAILGISERTVNAHIASAAEKLSAANRPHLVARAFILGMVSRSAVVLLSALVAYQCCSGNSVDARLMSRPARRRREEYHLTAPALS